MNDSTRYMVAVLFVSVGWLGACATSDGGGKTESGTSQQKSEANSSDAPPFLKNNELASGEAPAGGFSCPRYNPAKRTVYLPESNLRELARDNVDISRDTFEMIYHAAVHAKLWKKRIEKVRSQASASDQPRKAIIRAIQRERIRRAGSSKAFVTRRLKEEAALKKRAWQTANDSKRFGREPRSAAKLTPPESKNFRKRTRIQLDEFRKAFGDLFDS